MKVSEKAYIAAAIDCDGSISILRCSNRSSKSGFQYVLSINIKQNVKGKSMLEFIRNCFGGDMDFNTYAKYDNKDYPMYLLTLRSNKAKKALLKLMPFLILKKEQAKVGIAFQVVKNKFGRAHMTQERENFYELCKCAMNALNAPVTETEREKLSVQAIWKHAKHLVCDSPSRRD